MRQMWIVKGVTPRFRVDIKQMPKICAIWSSEDSAQDHAKRLKRQGYECLSVECRSTKKGSAKA